ncbi:phosphotransferase enzyme family protein [Nannizzia gypsea CBS 118893]|uniref:Altered inheritance of mitochondria protein 9, mitochondrial n=1 Tax=Arthroderma gypseum (strain ATCC MYA-4604 / CBS 118893) TaxID=535722 RepID=E5QYH8_ARTGP|nr:phosphotransferase enzyme family protein [Nannizzia gypsea CBS 118893]EFQ98054.1 phosphotransferase enzyme family protein [Nannizzia gypsea CBS 118893]
MITASEVATLEFLRTILDIPVPKVLAWSSPGTQLNPVGAEHMLIEKVGGRQLSEVWDSMSERQRFNLVKSVVEIEKKLMNTSFTGYGSLYYKDECEGSNSKCFRAISTDKVPGKEKEVSRFVIGPTTGRAFYFDNDEKQNVSHGPWKTAVEYLTAIAKREISLIQKLNIASSDDALPFWERVSTPSSSKLHVKLLEQFISVLPYIIPPSAITQPVLMHQDLHFDNIFVDATDPSKISGIIDWQATYASPIFMQARFPSIFDCDDPYTWGAVQLALPQEFETLSLEEKKLAEDSLDRLRLKKFYELASRKMNPLLVKAMDAMRNDEYPTSFIFYIVQQSAFDGPIPLRELLIQVYEQWDQVARMDGVIPACPISFTEEEIKQARQQAEEWGESFGEFENFRASLLGEDGWVPHEQYEEAKREFEHSKGELEKLREKLEQTL